ncbi:MAG: DNA mismatch repair protein MutS [Gammaproteobacteria bacterium]|nr:MAG: DNA mismatch repair protein MutS [Gammaproteobacteria bacterium]
MCSEEDRRLFRRYVGDVRRIEHDRVSRSPSPKARMKRAPKVTSQQTSWNEANPWIPPEKQVTGDSGLQFMRNGFSMRQMRRLKQGGIPVDYRIDLHGCTVGQALGKMDEVFKLARERQLRCVEVIHGKGYSSRGGVPVIKNALNHWLPQQAEVLAYCSAPLRQGGTGALLVFLKRFSD